jgi:hypothetical protein
LHALRADAKVLDAAALADRAQAWDRSLVVAVVTGQVLASEMVRERDFTVGASDHGTTVAAHYKRRGSSAVQKEDDLSVPGESA